MELSSQCFYVVNTHQLQNGYIFYGAHEAFFTNEGLNVKSQKPLNIYDMQNMRKTTKFQLLRTSPKEKIDRMIVFQGKLYQSNNNVLMQFDFCNIINICRMPGPTIPHALGIIYGQLTTFFNQNIYTFSDSAQNFKILHDINQKIMYLKLNGEDFSFDKVQVYSYLNNSIVQICQSKRLILANIINQNFDIEIIYAGRKLEYIYCDKGLAIFCVDDHDSLLVLDMTDQQTQEDNPNGFKLHQWYIYKKEQTEQVLECVRLYNLFYRCSDDVTDICLTYFQNNSNKNGQIDHCALDFKDQFKRRQEICECEIKKQLFYEKINKNEPVYEAKVEKIKKKQKQIDKNMTNEEKENLEIARLFEPLESGDSDE